MGDFSPIVLIYFLDALIRYQVKNTLYAEFWKYYFAYKARVLVARTDSAWSFTYRLTVSLI